MVTIAAYRTRGRHRLQPSRPSPRTRIQRLARRVRRVAAEVSVTALLVGYLVGSSGMLAIVAANGGWR
ncbi:hypothetical protein ORV05_05110 [Amycolatopsis cynarae]|uniref:Uncharacterized protein n=1 Tax=Amycolatopsis cynarae TaxID=2995223 RepID=A0ABY7B4D1_9PSEU|nr:hypothetical protein [Amycolatopsis sp. HUAS 11-8]WAL67172.1 hypothetical protein ORV05_05110 [Amycolatopsis sp. HUAS 11-8]